MIQYALKKLTRLTYDEALAKLPELLKDEGFGVLTEIDVKATIKKKLGLDFRRYKILGACNPPFAHQALSEEPDIGVMMPCNVVVYEGDDKAAHVSAINIAATVAALENPKLTELGRQVSERLARVLERL